jgi:FixJ family two-component response regulator
LHEVKKRHVETPVVLMTGMNDHVLLRHAFEAGAFDFLPKPLDRDDLSTTIQLAVCAYGLLRDINASQKRLRRYVERLRRLQTEAPLDVRSDLKELASDLLGEAGVVHTRALARVEDSKARIQRNEERVQETAKLLRAVQDIARQRSQGRTHRPL